jgi:SAM-dependent methyltransferase
MGLRPSKSLNNVLRPTLSDKVLAAPASEKPDQELPRRCYRPPGDDAPGKSLARLCQIVDVENYGVVNMANWDERVAAHVASPDYQVAKFIADPAFISRVVTFDRPGLGDLTGQRAVHLQCHIGTDTVSLARLGASMTGVDFSRPALEQARDLAGKTGADAVFVESEVYSVPDVLPGGSFDLVYTGIGAICWLPSISRWAQVVAYLLKPGGRLFIREGHPMLWTLAEGRDDDLLVVEESYFETVEPFVSEEGGTYVTTDVEFTTNVTHSWNHGLGEIVTALLDAGMTITALTEHDSVPWNALPGLMEMVDNNEWQLASRPSRLAHSFTLQAIKR